MTGAHGPTPDYCYDANSWVETYQWSHRGELIADLTIGEVMKVKTLISGPTKWAAGVVTERDDDGEPVNWEVRWFDTEAEARASSSPFPDGERDDR